MAGNLATAKLEIKRFFSKWILLVLAVVIAVGWYGLDNEVRDYKSILAGIQEFRETEKSTFEQFQSYTEYSKTGYNILTVPSPSSVFFTNPAIMTGLTARLNTVTVLDIRVDAKKKLNIDSRFPYRIHFSDIVTYLWSVLTLLFGFLSFRNKSYLRFLADRSTLNPTYFTITATRLFLVTASFLFVFGCMIGWVLMAGIEFTAADHAPLFGFTVTSLLQSYFFFALGTVIGFARSKLKGGLLLFAAWLTFVIVIPALIYSIAFKDSEDRPSPDKLRNARFRIVTEFEKMTDKKYGKFNKNNITLERKLVEEYYNNDFKKHQELERRHREVFEKEVRLNNALSIFFPTTFSNLTAEEAGSRGLDNYLEFYGYLIDESGHFLRHWFDRGYSEPPTDPVALVIYVKNAENIYRFRSRLPGTFSSGVWITLACILAFLGISFTPFNRPHTDLTPDATKEL
ncbi:MAG: hypothetical protein GY940_39985, partial [bacterium]|nr:hypothetical protein [bacterium]